MDFAKDTSGAPSLLPVTPSIHPVNGGKAASFFFGIGASKNTVWGMAAYDLRGMEDGNFSRFKCSIAMKNEVWYGMVWHLCNL